MRRSIRLRRYDYAQAGACFVTVVSRGRLCLFGDILDGEMRLSECGRIAQAEWFRTATLRRYVSLSVDEFIAMPNHVHGIIWITEDVVDAVGAQRRCAPTSPGGLAPGVVPASLSAIVRAFKSATSRHINRLRGTPGAPLWQRNYYQHVMRGDDQLAKIRRTIATNPLQWELDRENPNARGGADVPSIDEPWRE